MKNKLTHTRRHHTPEEAAERAAILEQKNEVYTKARRDARAKEVLYDESRHVWDTDLETTDPKRPIEMKAFTDDLRAELEGRKPITPAREVLNLTDIFYPELIRSGDPVDEMLHGYHPVPGVTADGVLSHVTIKGTYNPNAHPLNDIQELATNVQTGNQKDPAA